MITEDEHDVKTWYSSRRFMEENKEEPKDKYWFLYKNQQYNYHRKTGPAQIKIIKGFLYLKWLRHNNVYFSYHRTDGPALVITLDNKIYSSRCYYKNEHVSENEYWNI